jgi:HD-GYP domain-containing protein (c-di-GMP phosphodiesterase class II)
MLQVPGTILDNPGKLSEEDRARIKQHPETSFQMLSKLGSQYAWLAQIAWQEHERWNGQGYPRGLKGDHIHEYARIIGIVDIFEALMSPRPYRKRLLPHEAIRELLVAEKTSFPNQIIKALVQQFTLFPLGTRVKLNTGEFGVVSKLNQRFPLRPVLMIDTGGAAGASPRSIDLSTTTLVHIVEVIGSDAG